MGYSKYRSNESIEDYLESILMLQKAKGNVRSIDIAHDLNFSKPSVSVAMKSLREKEYITVADTGYITLTEKGMERAKSVLDRHLLLENWLTSIGVSKETAYEDACKMEHGLSEETFAAMKSFFEKINSNVK